MTKSQYNLSYYLQLPLVVSWGSRSSLNVIKLRLDILNSIGREELLEKQIQDSDDIH